jgi:hypothetical protein
MSSKAKNWKSGGNGQRNSVVPVNPSRSIPHQPLSSARKAKFLVELAKTGSFTAAARHTDGSEGTRRSYKVLQAKDATFARDCEESLHQYSEAVHQVIREQFFDGNISPVVSGGHIVKDKNGKEVWLKTKDSRILLNYLKRWKPEYTDAKNLNINVDGQPADPNDPEIRIRASDLWTLPAHEAEQLLGLLRKVHSNRSESLVDISPQPEDLEAEAIEEGNPYGI